VHVDAPRTLAFLQYHTMCYTCAIDEIAAPLRIFKNGWFQRFARNEKIADAMLLEAVHQAETGLIDANLGDGLIKQRIARAGGGKSGGYRSIIVFRSGDRAVFLFGFAKSAQANISKADLKLLKQAANEVLTWSDDEMDALVTGKVLMEIGDGEKDCPPGLSQRGCGRDSRDDERRP
jgi:Uncharacterized protein conserved in bacteria